MQQMRYRSKAGYKKTESFFSAICKKSIKKIAVAVLFATLVFPGYTNDRLQEFVMNYVSRNNKTIENDIAYILRGKTGINLNKQAVIIQLNELAETIVEQPDFSDTNTLENTKTQNSDNSQEASDDTYDSSLEDTYGYSAETSNENLQNYIYTLPYLTEEAVLVTRVGEDIAITKEINEGNSNRIYASFENDTVFRRWLHESHFENINNDSDNIADALELILDRKADFTILPYRMATNIINGAMLTTKLTTSRALFPIEYRFPVDIDDLKSFTKLNDELFKLEHDGTLINLHQRKGLKTTLVIEQESRLFKPILLTMLFLVICSFSIIYFILNLLSYRKEIYQNYDKKPKDYREDFSSISPVERLSIISEKNSAISVKITENSITDPYSGFFNTQYLRHKINDSFVQYAKNGSPFSIAMINATNRFDSLETMIQVMKKEISRLPLRTAIDNTHNTDEDIHFPIAEKNSSDKKVIAAHNGFGLFYILFPDKNQDEALHIIGERNCRFQNFSLLEYNGQDQYEFLGGLSLW